MLLGNCPVSVVNGVLCVDYPDKGLLTEGAPEFTKEDLDKMRERVRTFMARTRNVRFITPKALR